MAVVLSGGLSCASLADSEAAEIRFVDVARESGLRFEHVNGMQGARWLVEIIGAGAAVFDFDLDGRLDVWLVQGGPLRDRGTDLPSDQLFRNVGAGAALRFENVTASSGVDATGYGMGIATGDIDNDGDLDVFLANFGPNALYENLGDGRFRDVTRAFGLDGADEWSVAASFADFDRDGWDDLYVVNYVEYSLDANKTCHDLAGRPSYCTPEVYPAAMDRLYRNTGSGRMADVTAEALERVPGNGLGAVTADFDGDGWLDVYVANDAMSNVLWINQGDGTFRDEALLYGVAVNGDGKAEASMGVDAEDYDRDCDVDLFMTHLVAETNTLYVNEGGWFADRTSGAGLAASSSPFTGFGTAWLDADNDGHLDLISVNGAVTELAAQAAAGAPWPFAQLNQIWRNDGRGRYRQVRGGPAFALEEVSRGAAFGDLDNDGDVDVVVTNNNGPARLYRNETAGAHWLGIVPVDAGRKTGAAVRLESTPCGYRAARTDGSYASANDPRLVFGLGPDGGAQSVRVRWGDGDEERFHDLAADRYHRLLRGKGEALNPAAEAVDGG